MHTFKSQKPNHRFFIILVHLLLWLSVVMVMLSFLHRNEKLEFITVPISPPPMYVILTYLTTVISLFYLNAYFLVPKILNRKGIWAYLATLGVIVVCINWGIYLVVVKFLTFVEPYSFLPTSIVIIITSLAYSIVLENYKIEKNKKEQQNQSLEAELKFLRSQINPHFLFNVLNSFVALARKKSDLLEPSLLKLSEIMRYMTYESEENVLLEDELNYLENYIDLQRLRFGNHVDIIINFDKSGVSGKEIAPMLLIPLLENAFKHGTATINEPKIEANFKCLTAKTIVFEVKNKVSVQKCMRHDDNHGIGLQNLKKRLHLLYPTRYEFKTQQQNGVFSTFLKIEL